MSPVPGRLFPIETVALRVLDAQRRPVADDQMN
jgi:hypothetical protein